MLNFYQHIPQHLNPIAFSIGNFGVRWYSLAYLLGFCVVYGLLMFRVKRESIQPEIFNFQFSIFKQIPNSNLENSKLFQNSKFKLQNLIQDFLIYSFIGLIIGARLGYAIFYNLSYYFQNPLAVISPFQNGSYEGIFGMSYFGGLVGVIISSIIFCKIKKVDFWSWSDFVVPAIPVGYFFGRIGNFLNGELFGKPTDHFWGMYFGDGALRHPTQLYEALLEGLLLFLMLWFLSSTTFCGCFNRLANKLRKVVGDKPGTLFILYIAGYGMIRFFIEFWRENDGGYFWGMTTGQLLSLGIIMGAGVIYMYRLRIRNKLVK